MPQYTKVSGSWKTVSVPRVKVNSSWKNVVQGYVKVNGSWKQYYVSSISDDFNRANSAVTLGTSTSGQSWENLSGTWGISTNRAYAVTSNNSYPVATIDFGLPTFNMSTDILGTGTGLIFWATNANNWWAVTLTASTGTISFQCNPFACNCQTCCSTCSGTRCIGTPCRDGYCCNGSETYFFSCNCSSCNCQTCYNTCTGTSYIFNLNIISNINSVITQVATTQVEVNQSGTVNVAKITASISGNTISATARNSSNVQIGSTLSFTATNPTRGSRVGLVAVPSSYGLNVNMDNFSCA